MITVLPRTAVGHRVNGTYALSRGQEERFSDSEANSSVGQHQDTESGELLTAAIRGFKYKDRRDCSRLSFLHNASLLIKYRSTAQTQVVLDAYEQG